MHPSHAAAPVSLASTVGWKGEVTGNGALVHRVRVTAGRYKGHVLTFTQHSPDRYTVFGLVSDPNDGISIERRKQYQDQVLLHDSGAMLTLGEKDLWIAHSYRARSYYGVLAIGCSPQEAYENTFNRWNS